MSDHWTIKDCIEQIEKCEFECEGGPLHLNVGYIKLKARIAELDEANARIKRLVGELDTARASNHYNALHRDKLIARIAELEAQKTRSQEHYIKLLKDAEAENQRLREAFDMATKDTRYKTDDWLLLAEGKALLGGGE